MIDFKIVIAEPHHASELREVCMRSFFDTFNGTCTESDMEIYLTKTFPLTHIHHEISSTDCIIYLILLEDKICGYAKLAWQLIPEMQQRQAIELERLYVLKEFIGKGLGNRLMKKCLDTAAEKKAEVIYLGVWEHNYRAQKFYKNYGFEIFGEHPFPIESTPQTDLWMKKELM
ncbi:MAG: GNAT family N-acetyltransferase [Bacteroidetes bacterium]|nr:GNAT family N-acetyltransferase [Bacteroidota bacterium]